MLTSVRLDPETQTLIRRLARQTRRTRSDVIREAIRRMAGQVQLPSSETVYDRVADLVGIARGGDRHYASRSEEVLRALFAKKRAPR